MTSAGVSNGLFTFLHRYGFVVGHIVIPRINPYHLCAANNTGIFKISANTTARYDAYCYNATGKEMIL